MCYNLKTQLDPIDVQHILILVQGLNFLNQMFDRTYEQEGSREVTK